ncbi:MAG: ABC transporter permease [Cloacibacillus sp.]
MLKYILKRIFSALLTLWFIITITFLIMHNLPGSPFTGARGLPDETRVALEAKYGLDKSIGEQYVTYLFNFVRGDFGVSYLKRGVTTRAIIESGFPYSAKIGLVAIAMITAFGIFFGVYAALRQNKFSDRASMFLATLGTTIPSFVLATLFLYVFNKKLGLVPSYGAESFSHYIGPAFAIGAFSIAFITRLTRTSMLEVLQQDYIRTARAKGLSNFTVMTRHALRNALIPVVTYLGPCVATIVTGSFVVEKVFGIPGIGCLFTTSILNRDYSLILGVTVFFGFLLVLMVLLVDILYVLIDPRIKYE